MQGSEFLNYVLDSINQFYQIRSRKMFGGYGLYIGNKIFAIIADQELYFKAGSDVSDFLIQFDSEQFSYERNGKIIKMSYWRVAPEILDDLEMLKRLLDISFKSLERNIDL